MGEREVTGMVALMARIVGRDSKVKVEEDSRIKEQAAGDERGG